jgi:hypothetical protein
MSAFSRANDGALSADGQRMVKDKAVLGIACHDAAGELVGRAATAKLAREWLQLGDNSILWLLVDLEGNLVAS